MSEESYLPRGFKVVSNKNIPKSEVHFKNERGEIVQTIVNVLSHDDEQREKTINRMAIADVSVLLTRGNSHEREMAAKKIHNKSSRQNKPFVAINVSALSYMSCVSELFGHEKGSFTGAYGRKIGLLEIANGGTIFLDNVEALDPGPQSMLLSYILNRVIYRIGSTTPIPLDVRLISGSNDLESVVNTGSFREDLYYKINTVEIRFDLEVKATGSVFDVKYDPDVTIHELEKRHVLKALTYFKGNKTKAAHALGITIKTLYNKLHEYGEFENFKRTQDENSST